MEIKKFRIYMEEAKPKKEIVAILNKRYKEIEGYTLINGTGYFTGEKEYIEENSLILEILTNNLNHIYIDELCYFLKDFLKQEAIIYTEEVVNLRFIK